MATIKVYLTADEVRQACAQFVNENGHINGDVSSSDVELLRLSDEPSDDNAAVVTWTPC
jgi:hypothetical protein